LRDNPSLTTREIFGRNPIRILIDKDLKVQRNFSIYSHEAETLVFNSMKEEVDGHIKFIKTSRENFLQNMLQKLH